MRSHLVPLDSQSQRNLTPLEMAEALRQDPLRQMEQLTQRVLAEVQDENAKLTGEVAAALQAAANHIKGQLGTPNPELEPFRVLVVEDDFATRLMLQGLLSKYGECHIAVNGKEAVEAFRAARCGGQGYHLICMDIEMPEMNGQEAVKQIRAIEASDEVYLKRTRIFMTTGIQDMKTVVSSFQAICDAYLIKPIDGAKLEENLRAFGLIRSDLS